MPDEPEFATGGLIPGPKPGDPPPPWVVDSCMHGRFLADAWRRSEAPAWTVTVGADGTLHLNGTHGKQYEEETNV